MTLANAPTPLVIVATLALAGLPAAQADFGRPQPGEIGYWAPSSYREAIRRDVAAGRIQDPRLKLTQPVRRGTRAAAATTGCIDASHLFLFEDTAQLLLTNFSDGQLLGLMADAANALIAQEGDQYDFIGYWIDFTADHELGAAFYMPIFNDVTGIGDPSTVGTPVFDDRANLGLTTNRVQGYVMMWDVNHGYWQTGTAPGAAFTRLALAQEFEHRWAMFLPALLDGRMLQGNNGNCGRGFHWNFKVDGQGSGMEIAEWVGTNPAVLNGTLSFNTDIPGGVFSYTDLYLMGMVSAAEMDAGNSELRYLENSDCSSNYSGTISTFSSADIVAANGARVPDSASSPKLFRTGWIMIHLPGQPPTQGELDKAVAILDQHMVDWNESTLGRSVMDNTLFDDCPELLVYGGGVNPAGSMTVVSGAAKLGHSFTLGVDNPLGTQTAGSSVAVLLLAGQPHPNFPSGVNVPSLGMSGPGELLLDLSTRLLPNVTGPVWSGPGNPAPVGLGIPKDIAFAGFSFAAQGLLLDLVGPNRFGLADAVRVTIGP